MTETYHLFYQTFPNHVQGGNGSWGHAISQDLVTWEDVGGWKNDEHLALRPDPYPQYDWIGDWTGHIACESERPGRKGFDGSLYLCQEVSCWLDAGRGARIRAAVYRNVI